MAGRRGGEVLGLSILLIAVLYAAFTPTLAQADDDVRFPCPPPLNTHARVLDCMPPGRPPQQQRLSRAPGITPCNGLDAGRGSGGHIRIGCECRLAR
jgi:hypothetical protein